MKKNYIVAIALFAFFLTNSVATAMATVESSSSVTIEQRQEMKMEREENREQRKEEREEKRTERIEERQEKRAANIQEIAGRVEKRFAKHEERLQNWVDRVTKHISDKKAKGVDVSAAEKALETAKTSFATAKTLGATAVTKLKSVSTTNWEDQKTDAIAARDAVKKAQVAYAQVVKDMRLVLVELKK